MKNLERLKKPYTFIFIDARNSLYKYFYGGYRILKVAKTNKKIGTIYGFLRQYLQLQIAYPRSKIYYLHEGKSFRKALAASYKANRKKPPDEMDLQFDETKKVLEWTKAIQVTASGVEADDLVGYLLKKYSYDKALLISDDSDWSQFVSDKVDIKIKSVIRTRKYIEEHLGFPARSLIIYKTLRGDASDNIKGISHFSTETAVECCLHCNNFKQLVLYLEDNKRRLEDDRDRFVTNIEQAKLNYKLVKPYVHINSSRVFYTFGEGEWTDLLAYCKKVLQSPSLIKLIYELAALKSKGRPKKV